MSALLTVQAQVLHALMLRDMRTRFGRSHWGFVVTVLWPFGHILMIVTIMAVRRLPDPLGDSVILFVTTGCLPMITFIYITRKIPEAISMNRQLTFFPQVTMLDIVLARTVLEIAASFGTILAIFIFLNVMGLQAIPYDPAAALETYVASIILSCGVGFLNGCISLFFPPWGIGFILVIILLYSISGVYMLPEIYPEQILYYLRFNPMLHCISSMRAAWYPGYRPEASLIYPCLFGGCLIIVGLLTERLYIRSRPA